MNPTLPAFSGDLEAARRGDRNAFARMVEQHRNLVSSIALAIVRDVGTSEDVSQDVFVAAWQRLGELRNPSSLLPWLRQITRNRARDARASLHRMTPDDATVAAAVDPSDLLQRAQRTEQELLLAECLEALSDDDREAVTLFYREGQSVRQVAVLLELSEDAVKKRLSRARERLRESLMVRFGEAAEETRPGSEFTRAVMVALPMGAAPGLFGAGAVGTAAKFVPFLGGAALGLGSSLAGVWTGVSRGLKVARDEQERRELKRYGWWSTAVIVTFMTGVLSALALEAPKWVVVVLWAAFAMTMLAMSLLWGPKISARRLAAEVAEDPGAAARHARDRRIAIAATVAAYAAGTTPIVLYVLGIIG